ncbi:MAG: hypothetical protein GX282_02690 [Campylobacteraceae bacterium]|nr:hypothetical protein [Campylobacteraceae bacterium]
MKKEFMKFITSDMGFLFLTYVGIVIFLLLNSFESFGVFEFIAASMFAVFLMPFAMPFTAIVYFILETIFGEKVRKYLKSLK